MNAIVILSDVAASRRLDDRQRYARRLDRVLDDLNTRDGVVGAFERQAGLDEFAGIVLPGYAGAFLLELWTALHPVSVRYAVVRGALDIVPDGNASKPPRASGFDGPAFHEAAEILGELRSATSRLVLRVAAEDRRQRLLECLGDLAYARLLAWTDRQMEVARSYRETGSQETTAARLGVEQSTVSRVLKAADWSRVDAALRLFATELDTMCERKRERGRRAAVAEGRPPSSESEDDARR